MIIFDTETTGLLLPDTAPLDKQPHIIEIGALKMDRKYKVIGELSILVKPPIPIDEELHKRITKLTNKDLEDKPDFGTVYPELADFFLGETDMFAHNMPFDLGMLTNELRRINAQYAFPYPLTQICTAEYTAQKHGKRMRLVNWYEVVMGKPLNQKHRALDDCKALGECIRKLKL